MDDIKVPPRLLIIFLGFCVCFLYFNEKFSKPEFKTFVHKAFKPVLGNQTNHTLINMIDTNSGIVAAGLSTSVVTMISYFPKLVTEPRTVVYGLVATGALGIAKYKLDWIDWGFFPVNKSPEKPDQKKET
ncbi:unnamed protein product [Brachionus calyciflorus]|uniref:Uncharacterized protein n=1 Tax=Brachionus calyciflorus TaxID=104777 RepID=A0A814AS30_9BILA|nr:unnamed protein product [Brachionus calyciflorus]